MKPTNPDDKPAADQAPLQKLLSAAYVVQQHNERLQAGKPSETGSARILKEVLQVQEQLRASNPDLREKAALIARRVRQMTQADGSAVGIVGHREVEYYAATGIAASQSGARVPLDSSLSRECLRTAHLLQCPAAEADARLDPELCRRLGLKALIAIPVKYESAVAGVLELHFAQAHAFQEEEIRTAELIAALVTEAILKPAHPQPKQREIEKPVVPHPEPSQTKDFAMPAQHSFPPQDFPPKDKESLLAALEKIRPRLEQLAKNPAAVSRPPEENSSSLSAESHEPAVSSAGVCRSCGHKLSEDEVFCGICGSSRQAQRIWSSLWALQKTAEKSANEGPADSAVADGAFEDPLDVFPSELEEIVAQFSGKPLEESPAKPPQVPLPSFAEGLVSAKMFSPEMNSGEAGSAHDSVVEDRAVPDPGASVLPSSETSSEVPDSVHESYRPFLLEKSIPKVPSQDEEYPPFSGFASDSSLLSLSAGAEAEPPSTAHEQPPSASTDTSWLNQSGPWGSAVKTKEWLEIQHNKRAWLAQKWRQQRANIYLAASALLLLAVLLGWGSPAKHRTNSQGTNHANNSQPSPQPDLSLGEKLLVDLGLAEVPAQETTENPGNPETQVWVDVHTALYYCPGESLYGKTPGGHTLSQREAQQDQFQPAARTACN